MRILPSHEGTIVLATSQHPGDYLCIQHEVNWKAVIHDATALYCPELVGLTHTLSHVFAIGCLPWWWSNQQQRYRR